ncbi:hypothetical protein BDN70DRAFT_934454 [Pholiota conissans]|uniref:Uncharacterized protein n=1 Tax=Pholiota conissans TaxID=109636 RepID=A0A9P6CY52_9AGAR|nr:hypothetical protein BDN70DRAFT_934454 [Pholiota conissans]
MPRWVMVDDTDPAIKYTGDWTANKGGLDASGNWGLPYLSTVHATKTSGSFTYTFSGTEFTVTGSIQIQRTVPSENTSWECIVDGTSITVDNPQGVENRMQFCAKAGLSDGPHTLRVNAAGTSVQTFYFDHLQYIPSASVSLENKSIYIDVGDPMWQFDKGWFGAYPGFMTNATGSKVNFEFTGVSFIWYGFYAMPYPFAPTTASYSMDGGAPISFTLNGIAAQATIVQYQQVFFTTQPIVYGIHNVEVTYNGDSDSTPLSVQVIVVQTGSSSNSGGGGGGEGATTGATTSAGRSTSPSAMSSGSTTATTGITTGISASTTAGDESKAMTGGSVESTTTTSSTLSPTLQPNNSDTSSTSSKSNMGAIVGGAVGGLAILLIFILLLFWLWRRSKRRDAFINSRRITRPDPYVDGPSDREMYQHVSHSASRAVFPSPPSSGYSSSFGSPTATAGLNSPLSSDPSRSRKGGGYHGVVVLPEPTRVVQDLDSGLRLVDVGGEGAEFVHVLPPVYTQT